MTTLTDEKVVELEAEIAALKAMIRPRRRFGRKPFAIAGLAVLTLGTLAGVAGASGTTTNVPFVALTPAKVILSNASITTHKSSSPVVIGGTTTVPSNATTVEIQVSAKGATAAGTLDFYPAGNPTGASGQTLTYAKGTTLANATIQENVGQSGELTIYNAGAGTATVTAKIIGYSTKVTAGDIAAPDGQAGQALTADGSGGASWQVPGTDYVGVGTLNSTILHNQYTTVDSVTVPPGTYDVTDTISAYSTVPDVLICHIYAPDGRPGIRTNVALGTSIGGNYHGTGVVAAVLSTTTGGNITVQCLDGENPSGATNAGDTLVVRAIGSASGAVVN